MRDAIDEPSEAEERGEGAEPRRAAAAAARAAAAALGPLVVREQALAQRRAQAAAAAQAADDALTALAEAIARQAALPGLLAAAAAGPRGSAAGRGRPAGGPAAAPTALAAQHAAAGRAEQRVDELARGGRGAAWRRSRPTRPPSTPTSASRTPAWRASRPSWPRRFGRESPARSAGRPSIRPRPGPGPRPSAPARCRRHASDATPPRLPGPPPRSTWAALDSRQQHDLAVAAGRSADELRSALAAARGQVAQRAAARDGLDELAARVGALVAAEARRSRGGARRHHRRGDRADACRAGPRRPRRGGDRPRGRPRGAAQRPGAPGRVDQPRRPGRTGRRGPRGPGARRVGRGGATRPGRRRGGRRRLRRRRGRTAGIARPRAAHAALPSRSRRGTPSRCALEAAADAPELAALDPERAERLASRRRRGAARDPRGPSAVAGRPVRSHTTADEQVTRVRRPRPGGRPTPTPPLSGRAPRHRPLERLAGLAKGTDGHRRVALTTYVLRLWFEQGRRSPRTSASQAMSAGRYSLERVDGVGSGRERSGLTLRVVDAHTGQSRSEKSLSGGETFYTSLALALGVADVVQRRGRRRRRSTRSSSTRGSAASTPRPSTRSWG